MKRVRRRLSCATALAGLFVFVGPMVVAGAAIAPGATAGSASISQRVIIVLKRQESSLPATAADIASRRAVIARDQQPVASQLSASAARNVHSYTLIDALSATVSQAELARLKSNSAVSEVVPDEVVGVEHVQTAAAGADSPAVAPLPGACARRGQVQLDPQALETIHADEQTPGHGTARSLGLDGRGVKVAFIAGDINVNNPDFIRRDGAHVFIDYKDFSGQGTAAPTSGAADEAFGDASMIAAQGREVYDVSHYSALPLDRRCPIRIEGVAPGASLVGLNVFHSGLEFDSALIQAIDYAVIHDHVQVLNESLNTAYYPDDSSVLNLVKQVNDAAVAAGTTVTTSAGDAGVTSTIESPATDPNVISVGSSTTYRLLVQDGLGAAHLPAVKGWLNNNISSFSSAGFQQGGHTVDVVAPGESNWALCTPTRQYPECTNPRGKPTRIEAFEGTSQAAPVTAGVAALVIEAFRRTHKGASPSPALVKQIILSTADDSGAPADQQGSGRIDAYRAVIAAESYRSKRKVGQTLLLSATQLHLVSASPGNHFVTERVTNNGRVAQKVAVSTRAIGAYTTLKTTRVRLSDSSSRHVISSRGARLNLESITFKLPAGENRLNAAIAFQSPSGADAVQLTLVDPHGALAIVAAPEGHGNYDDGQVTDPAPGTWTAYVFSPESRAGGTAGPVMFRASAARYAPFGTVAPSTLTLVPGESRTVTLRINAPAVPGDSAGAIVLSTSGRTTFRGVTTVPVTLRTLIPNGRQAFTQTLTGGNGRSSNTGQSFYYQLRLPAGRHELNASVKLANNPNNEFDMWLIAPNGNAQAFSTNHGHTKALGAQLHVLSPSAGLWTLVITFAPNVSGTAISEPFTVTTNDSPVPSSAPGLPDSAASKLTAGGTYSYSVHVLNNGPSPERYFVDARLPASTDVRLAAYPGPITSEPFTASSQLPTYLVPTHTSRFVAFASTSGPRPIEFEVRPVGGDPDIGSTAGKFAARAYSANPIVQGFWQLIPQEVGPFGASQGPRESVTTAMVVRTAAFDPAVHSPTGDLWLSSANKASQYLPLRVEPGHQGTIHLTITPTAGPGTTVSGTLYIDDVSFNQGLDTGDDVVALPYEYTVG